MCKVKKMNKKVFCVIGERCKAIRYTKTASVSDLEAICRSLESASKTNILLQSMIEGKSIVLQRMDPDRNNQWCDIEDDDEVKDKEDVRVILINLPQTVIASNLLSDKVFPKGSSFTIDLPVLQRR